MVFDYRKTSTALSVKYEQTSVFALAKILAPLSIILFVLTCLVIFITHNDRLWLLNFIFMVSIPILLYLRLGLSDRSIKYNIDQITANSALNIAEAMSQSAIDLFLKAESTSGKYRIPMAPFALMYGFLGDIQGRELFMRLGLFIRPESLIQFNDQIIDKPGAIDALMQESIKFAQENNEKHIHIEDFLVGLVRTDELFKRFLDETNLDEKAILEIAVWHKRVRKERIKLPFWEASVIGGVGQEWSYGYTKLMQQFALNLTKVSLAMESHIQIFSRNSYVQAIGTNQSVKIIKK